MLRNQTQILEEYTESLVQHIQQEYIIGEKYYRDIRHYRSLPASVFRT